MSGPFRKPFWFHGALFWGGSGRPLGAVSGPVGQKRGRRQFRSPARRLKKGVLGPSWAALGALLGALGAILGPSGASLGALSGHIRAILRPPEPFGSERARRQITVVFLSFWSNCGFLGGGLWRARTALGIVLEPLGCASEAILSHLEVCWAILEATLGFLRPSWTQLGPKRTLRHIGPPPVQTQEACLARLWRPQQWEHGHSSGSTPSSAVGRVRAHTSAYKRIQAHTSAY